MGIVKVSNQLHEAAKKRGRALNRSINAQAEHWMKIGKMVEEQPELTYRQIWQMLVEETEEVASD